MKAYEIKYSVPTSDGFTVWHSVVTMDAEEALDIALKADELGYIPNYIEEFEVDEY